MTTRLTVVYVNSTIALALYGGAFDLYSNRRPYQFESDPAGHMSKKKKKKKVCSLDRAHAHKCLST